MFQIFSTHHRTKRNIETIRLSYQSLEDSDKVKKEGNKRKADELAGESVVLAQLAADYATTFSAFCK